MKNGSTFACDAGDRLLIAIFRDLDLRKIALDISIGGVELVGEARLLGQAEIDGAVAILHCDVAEGRSAGEVY